MYVSSSLNDQSSITNMYATTRVSHLFVLTVFLILAQYDSPSKARSYVLARDHTRSDYKWKPDLITHAGMSAKAGI